MKATDNCINMIAQFEGCILKAYADIVGVMTIGYGHTGSYNGKKIVAGMTISKDDAKKLLVEDVRKFENGVNKCMEKYGYDFNQNQFDALVSFSFNCGLGNLTKLTNSGKRSISEIGEKLLAYNKAGGKEVKGLTNRRIKEKELYFKAASSSAKVDKDSNKYYPKYTGNSSGLDDILRTIGADKDFDKITGYRKRKPIATANGIIPYTGSLTQNIQIIALAKNGKLKRP